MCLDHLFKMQCCSTILCFLGNGKTDLLLWIDSFDQTDRTLFQWSSSSFTVRAMVFNTGPREQLHGIFSTVYYQIYSNAAMLRFKVCALLIPRSYRDISVVYFSQIFSCTVSGPKKRHWLCVKTRTHDFRPSRKSFYHFIVFHLVTTQCEVKKPQNNLPFYGAFTTWY